AFVEEPLMAEAMDLRPRAPVEAHEAEEPLHVDERVLAPRSQHRPARLRAEPRETRDRVVKEDPLGEAHSQGTAVAVPLPLVLPDLDGGDETGGPRVLDRCLDSPRNLALDPVGPSENAEPELPVGILVAQEEERIERGRFPDLLDERRQVLDEDPVV